MWVWWHYSIFGNETVTAVTGCIAALEVYSPGMEAGEMYQPGAAAMEVYQGGMTEGQAGC